MDSLHNLAADWLEEYGQFAVHVELIHGVNGMGLRKTQLQTIGSAQNSMVFADMVSACLCAEVVQLRFDDVSLAKFPRETQVSFALVAKPKGRDEDVYLASGVVPVFSRER